MALRCLEDEPFMVQICKLQNLPSVLAFCPASNPECLHHARLSYIEVLQPRWQNSAILDFLVVTTTLNHSINFCSSCKQNFRLNASELFGFPICLHRIAKILKERLSVIRHAINKLTQAKNFRCIIEK